VESIHDTLNGLRWSTAFNLRFSSDLDDIVLVQLSLSTIILQFVFLILMNVRKVALFPDRPFQLVERGYI